MGFSAGVAAPVLLDDPVVGRVACSPPLAVVPDGWYQQVISLVARVDGLDHRSIVLLAAVVEGPCLLDRLGACWEAPWTSHPQLASPGDRSALPSEA